MADNQSTKKKNKKLEVLGQSATEKRATFDFVITDQENKNLSRTEIETQILRLSSYVRSCDSNIENINKQLEKVRQGDIDQKLINRSVEAFDLDNPFSTEV